MRTYTCTPIHVHLYMRTYTLPLNDAVHQGSNVKSPYYYTCTSNPNPNPKPNPRPNPSPNPNPRPNPKPNPEPKPNPNP